MTPVRPTWLARCAAGLLLAASLAGCSKKLPAGTLPPLTSAGWRTSLAVPGFGPATVGLPLLATSPRPIAVVIHGSHDRPEWQCGSFRGLLGGNVFVLCPQGKAVANDPTSFTLGDVGETEAELRAALVALKARFGPHVAAGPILILGYGAGADQVADLVRREPSFFARVGLIGGNPAAFTTSATSIYAKGGGKRVLFFCADAVCEERAQPRVTLLLRGRVAAKVVQRPVGPWFDARFAQALVPELRWLAEGDARWPSAPKKG